MSTKAHTVPRFQLSEFVARGAESDQTPWIWIGSIATDEVKRRAPKNISISRGLYDGRGSFREVGATVEAHLAMIEGAAAAALRDFAATAIGGGEVVPQAIIRLMAWQVARTPGWMDLAQSWANESWPTQVIEPPPEGFDRIEWRHRDMLLENPSTHERRWVKSTEEFVTLKGSGWSWLLQKEDHLEALHLNAWYLQVRHFPRLSWFRIEPPVGGNFIISDRGVAWLVNGKSNAKPAELRNSSAVVLAPLTRNLALIGKHGKHANDIKAREFNGLVASTASRWIAGPTADVVKQALADRGSL